jgi:hypothetical protein
MIIIHMFFQNYYTICLKICYKLVSFFSIWIKCIHLIVVTINTFHDLKIHKINFFIIIYIIEKPTNCIPIMSFPFLLLSMKCLKGFFHFIVFIRVRYFLCFILFCLKATIHNLITYAIHLNQFHFHHQLSSHFHFDLFPFLTKK